MVALVKLIVKILKLIISLGKFGFLDDTISKLDAYIDKNS